MTIATPSGYLSYAAQSGQPNIPLNNFLITSGTGSSDQVNDGNSDGNADTGTDYFGDPGESYTGWTINIGGLEYAIFEISGSTSFFRIPYFNSVADLSGLQGTPVPLTFTNSGDNAGVVNLCFAASTMIATPDGEVAVESLQTGDLITTADGRAVPVKWLGCQTHRPLAVNMPLPEGARAVRIDAGALGNGLPLRDLTVTADHGMILDDLVINAAALVNGTTIDFVPLSELPTEMTVFHIETEAHDIILAEGAPAETFIDAAGRAAFDNHQDYLDLYGADRLIPEMDRPRIASQRLLPDALRNRLGIGADPEFDLARSG